MKIVFFGSSHFAVPALEALINSPYEVCCVVTQPDKKKGRHLRLGATDVKAVASRAGLDIFQPQDLNSPDSIRYLKSLSADIFVVVAYGQILSQAALDTPKNLTINIHASLLPKYRGAAPINWAIINGEKITGITIIKLNQRMDAGPILMQKEVPVKENDDSIILEDKLRTLGAGLLMDALKDIKDKTFKLTEQNENNAVMAPKLKKVNGYINWAGSAQDIRNLVRGCLPWPGAFTYYKSKLLKIFKAEAAQSLSLENNLQQGEVSRITSDKNGIVVAAGKGVLMIEELQLEGGKRMTAKEFVQGHKIRAGDMLGKK